MLYSKITIGDYMNVKMIGAGAIFSKDNSACYLIDNNINRHSKWNFKGNIKARNRYFKA